MWCLPKPRSCTDRESQPRSMSCMRDLCDTLDCRGCAGGRTSVSFPEPDVMDAQPRDPQRKVIPTSLTRLLLPSRAWLRAVWKARYARPSLLPLLIRQSALKPCKCATVPESGVKNLSPEKEVPPEEVTPRGPSLKSKLTPHPQPAVLAWMRLRHFSLRRDCLRNAANCNHPQAARSGRQDLTAQHCGCLGQRSISGLADTGYGAGGFV